MTSDVSHSNFFLYMSPEAREIKAKINYGGYIKMKSFCTKKETINRHKDKEKIFENDICNKEIASKIYEELIHNSTPKRNNQIKKCQKT